MLLTTVSACAMPPGRARTATSAIMASSGQAAARRARAIGRAPRCRRPERGAVRPGSVGRGLGCAPEGAEGREPGGRPDRDPPSRGMTRPGGHDEGLSAPPLSRLFKEAGVPNPCEPSAFLGPTTDLQAGPGCSGQANNFMLRDANNLIASPRMPFERHLGRRRAGKVRTGRECLPSLPVFKLAVDVRRTMPLTNWRPISRVFSNQTRNTAMSPVPAHQGRRRTWCGRRLPTIRAARTRRRCDGSSSRSIRRQTAESRRTSAACTSRGARRPAPPCWWRRCVSAPDCGVVRLRRVRRRHGSWPDSGVSPGGGAAAR